MKIIKNIAVFASCAIGLSSCNFLDFDESTGMTKEEAYSYFSNVSNLSNAIYKDLPQDYGIFSGALREAGTDNAVYTWNNNVIYDIYTGAWTSLNAIDNEWSKYYTIIRSANSFLENYSEENLKRFEWDANYEDNLAKVKMSIFEVRALRAFYHFELAKRYGDIPLVKRTLTPEEANTIEKTPFAEVINFIVSELDSVAPELPITHKDFFKETGRMTRGAAMAIKARALLYAASPLHNVNNDTNLWKEAALEANSIIKAGWYTLPPIKSDPLFGTVGGHEVFKSPQLIFERRNGSEANTFEARNMPFGIEGSQGGNTPTQNLVDAFDMRDGSAFDWNNTEHVKNIYYDENGDQTRDPRFYLNVICNEMMYMKTKVETFEGGKNAFPIEGATLTGYYLKKLLNEGVSMSPIKPVKKFHHYPSYRYAEVLLNYAEAMNEWKGSDTKEGDCVYTAREALNLVRSAAGMPAITVSGEEFTAKIKNERRIELAFEDHRAWDIRRWKMGELVKEIYGVKILNNEGGVSYTKKKIQDRYWDDKMYLYPIPINETYKNNNLTQNPGW